MMLSSRQRTLLWRKCAQQMTMRNSPTVISQSTSFHVNRFCMLSATGVPPTTTPAAPVVVNESNATPTALPNQQQEQEQQITEEEQNQRRARAIKVAKNALIVATVIDLVIAVVVLLFVREYWGIKTIPEFKQAMKELIGDVAGEDFVKRNETDQLTEEEKQEKLRRLLPNLGKEQEQQKEGK